jgi:hypothetical protein
MWERKDDAKNNDNWWFKVNESDLHRYQYLMFCGALDYSNSDFRLLKVPTAYVLANLSEVDMVKDEWINLYISFEGFVDLRSKKNLSFSNFVVN